MFKKQLKIKPEVTYNDESKLENKTLCVIGQIHLFTCILIMAISNYINLEMWYIPVAFSISLIISWLIHKLVTKDNNKLMKESAKTAISYIRSVADKYGVSTDFYTKKDIYLKK